MPERDRRASLWHSGECVALEAHNTLYLEHLSAYAYAERFATDRVVLDVGCGAGYGAARLAPQARRVLAIDVDVRVAKEAARSTRSDRVAVAAMDARRLGVRDETVDLVCAFQVLEHLADAERFVAEVARVLRPRGIAIVSTPNALTHLGPKNPFHEREFSPADLEALFRRHFSSVAVFGQRRPPEVYELEAACERVRRWDLFGLKRLVPRRLVSAMVYVVARWNAGTPGFPTCTLRSEVQDDRESAREFRADRPNTSRYCIHVCTLAAPCTNGNMKPCRRWATPSS